MVGWLQIGRYLMRGYQMPIYPSCVMHGAEVGSIILICELLTTPVNCNFLSYIRFHCRLPLSFFEFSKTKQKWQPLLLALQPRLSLGQALCTSHLLGLHPQLFWVWLLVSSLLDGERNLFTPRIYVFGGIPTLVYYRTFKFSHMRTV